MDFFQSQDNARRNTKLLIGLFVAAVVSIVVLTNLLILAVVNYSNTYTIATGAFQYDWGTVVLVSLGVVGFIVLGSAYRILSLGKGGQAVAEMLEGVLLADPGSDLAKKRLLNIVEEMAIASGTPVPPVYLITDPSVNAFAAGYSRSDAVIAVTTGALDNLTREQLQGVIAHEFSHILNGDMRLNIRLMGVLYGILMLAVIGRILLSPGRAHGSRRDSATAMVALGVGLLVLGYVGKFFGNLIKAAVSRQREFLADAAAVQFTRNPDGIGGALRRIGGYESGSILQNAKGEEWSHAFFCQGVNVMFSSLLATHPPLAERIRRIDPKWDGAFIREPPADFGDGESPLASGFAGATVKIDAAGVVGDIGNPTPAHVAVARDILGAMPPVLIEAAREPYSARAVVYLALLDVDPLIRSRQIDHLEESADPLVFARLQELVSLVGRIEPVFRLPLIEVCLASVRQLSVDQHQRFLDNVDVLIKADQKIALSEWAIQQVLTKHLEGVRRPAGATGTRDIATCVDECARLISMLAYSDSKATIQPEVAFAAGKEALDLPILLMSRRDLGLSTLNAAIAVLATVQPLKKPRLLKACVATVAADGQVAVVEAELLRAIADTLDCPMPPILATTTPRN